MLINDCNLKDMASRKKKHVTTGDMSDFRTSFRPVDAIFNPKRRRFFFSDGQTRERALASSQGRRPYLSADGGQQKDFLTTFFSKYKIILCVQILYQKI
jgi:hypothetical protein